MGAASLFAATFSYVRHSALHNNSFSVPSAVPTFRLFRPIDCAQLQAAYFVFVDASVLSFIFLRFKKVFELCTMVLMFLGLS